MSAVASVPLTTGLELTERAKQLHAQIAGWRDDRERQERRYEELEEERRRLEQRLEVVADSIAALERRIAGAQQELLSINALVKPDVTKPPAPARPPRREAKPEAVRAAILRFGEGTVADVAAYLRLTTAQVKPLMDAEAEAGIIQWAGRKMGGSPWWEYVAPTEPGMAFEKQQEHRQQEPDTMAAIPIAGVGEGLLGMLHKDVRKAARRAIQKGFVLTETGSTHAMLNNGIDQFTFSKTPNNPVGIAKRIDTFVRNFPAGAPRGKAVPFTGRPMGRTGHPGLDKRLAESGRRVVKRKGK